MNVSKAKTTADHSRIVCSSAPENAANSWLVSIGLLKSTFMTLDEKSTPKKLTMLGNKQREMTISKAFRPGSTAR